MVKFGDYTAFGGYKGFFGGGKGKTGHPQPSGYGFNPAMYQAFGQFLPASGQDFQSQGYRIDSPTGGAMSKLQGIRGVQLSDFLSSMQMQNALTPMYAQQQMDVMGQVIPGQLNQLAGFKKQELDLLSGLPQYSDYFKNQTNLMATGDLF